MALTAKKVYAILKRQISDMEAKLNSPVRYRGTVATADLLPLNPDIGDMYNIESKSIYGEAGMNVAWNGVVWDTMGAPIDMSLYLTKEEAEAVIQRLVTEYFEKNPVKPGATTEQAQQIEQNKTDIASLKTETGSLKEDLSNKITKFYASNQGETHLADSDNGKIMDMMIYGKSEQKQYSGKNLLNATLQTTTRNGVTCTNNGDGTYTLNGTATATGIFILHSNIDFTGQMRLCGGTSLVSLQYSNSSNFAYEDKGAGIIIEHFDSVTYPNVSFNILIKADNVYNNALIKPMLTTDLTATYDDFEPYTGGIPSPNPDYPQEIKSVVNPTVKVCGKNLLKATLQTATVNGVTCTNNGDGTYTLNGTASEGNPSFRIGKIIAKSGRKLVGSPGAAGSYVSYLPNGTWNNATEEKGDGSIISNIGKGTDEIAIVVLNGTTVKNLLFKPMLTTDLTATYDDFEPYHEQTVTIPYTLNAIPVNSGGNVTIDGQQYIADYVDVERGKLVRMCKELVIKNATFTITIGTYSRIAVYDILPGRNITNRSMCSHSINKDGFTLDESHWYIYNGTLWLFLPTTEVHDQDSLDAWLENNDLKILVTNEAPEEIDLTTEEIAAFKALATYYPTTNISVNSEQLDGYTVFNYPISMQNGWNYVKQQIGDTRDYIYDMDARTQDTDLQAAEAYVNSEYAVALTELEV
jgi:hypothetical protein